MPSECAYVASDGSRFELDEPGRALVGTGAALRGHEWSYDLGWRSVSSQSRDAREVSLDVVLTDMAAWDALAEAADRDMADGAPGTLVAGGWEQRAYLTSFDPGTVYAPAGLLAGTLGAVLLDGCWRSWSRLEVLPQGAADADGGLDYEHDWPWDPSTLRTATSLTVDSLMPAPARLVIYGPCASPSVTIGENEYSFSIDVPSGAILTCDGTSWPRSIELRAANGDVSDAFSCGERGAGEGCGAYCFQPLAPGRSLVTTDGSFGVDVEWCVERGEPAWSS